MTVTTTALTIALPPQYGSAPHPQPTTPTLLQQLLFQRDATSTSLFIALPPLLRPMSQCLFDSRSAPLNGNPDLRPTSAYCTCTKDLMRTLTLTLPLLNPFASRDSRVDVIGVCGDPPRPLHLRATARGSARCDRERRRPISLGATLPAGSPALRPTSTCTPRFSNLNILSKDPKNLDGTTTQ